MGRPSHDRGRAAEHAAREALSAAGFQIIETNYRVTGAELDVVCRDDEGLVFAEVRGRGPGALEAGASVDGRKFRHLMRGARAWLVRHQQQSAPWRFVVVAVGLDDDGTPVATEIIEDPFAHLPEYHHGDP